METLNNIIGFIIDHIHTIGFIAAYLAYTALIITVYNRNFGFGDKYIKRLTKLVSDTNIDLYQKYLDKKISARVYQDSKMDLQKTLKSSRIINFVIAPIAVLHMSITLLAMCISKYVLGNPNP